MLASRPQIVLFLSVIFSAVLMIVDTPIGSWIANYQTGIEPLIRPEWVLLVCLYWAIYAPTRFSVLFAWCSGIVLDLLTASFFGKHALALTLCIALAQALYQQLRAFPLGQQAVVVALIAVVYRILIVWIDGATGQLQFSAWQFAPALTSAVAWPFIFIFLNWQSGRHGIS